MGHACSAVGRSNPAGRTGTARSSRTAERRLVAAQDWLGSELVWGQDAQGLLARWLWQAYASSAVRCLSLHEPASCPPPSPPTPRSCRSRQARPSTLELSRRSPEFSDGPPIDRGSLDRTTSVLRVLHVSSFLPRPSCPETPPAFITPTNARYMTCCVTKSFSCLASRRIIGDCKL